jgi:DNA-directed RNA polymerase specialized sigma24 family protein
MDSTGQGLSRHGIEASKAMAGVLALLIEEREERLAGDREAPKIEVLLARIGFSNEDIAAVTGKKPDAVRKVIERAAKAK